MFKLVLGKLNDKKKIMMIIIIIMIIITIIFNEGAQLAIAVFSGALIN